MIELVADFLESFHCPMNVGRTFTVIIFVSVTGEVERNLLNNLTHIGAY